MLFNIKVAAVAAVAALATVALGAGSGPVVDLTPKNFKQVVDGSKDVLVKFYAPWCGHCKNMAEDYEKLAEGYSHASDIVIAEVNADEHRDLGNQFAVQGFPTLKFFPKGEDIKTPVDYSSGRDLDSLVDFVREKTGVVGRIKKPVSLVEELDFDKFKQIALDEDKFVLVEFYAPWCGHCKRLAPIYAQLSEVFQNDDNVVIANYDASEDTKIRDEVTIQGFPTLIAFPAGKDAKRIEFEGDRSLESLVAFRKKIISNAKVVASEVHDKAQAKFAKYYVKVMEKVSSASDFAARESERLANIVKSGAVNAGKLDSFAIRQNVLDVFLGKAKDLKNQDEAAEAEAEASINIFCSPKQLPMGYWCQV
ncbi:disulfide isomerase [Linderina pennispora]|uniref:protein disulfide-isomerase n=1 Tax=Linderina pennispora TaxID=61395 RepID=A0A1Y1W4W6_9FUNG|nr:disulfide isomerase [Linderina pennispora]ORX68593.1 disulfide isomerase [Linderina pennispora]